MLAGSSKANRGEGKAKALGTEVRGSEATSCRSELQRQIEFQKNGGVKTEASQERKV